MTQNSDAAQDRNTVQKQNASQQKMTLNGIEFLQYIPGVYLVTDGLTEENTRELLRAADLLIIRGAKMISLPDRPDYRRIGIRLGCEVETRHVNGKDYLLFMLPL